MFVDGFLNVTWKWSFTIVVRLFTNLVHVDACLRYCCVTVCWRPEGCLCNVMYTRFIQREEGGTTNCKNPIGIYLKTPTCSFQNFPEGHAQTHEPCYIHCTCTCTSSLQVHVRLQHGK